MAAIDFRLWLSTFRNQHRLARVISVGFSATLMIIGLITFAMTGPDNNASFQTVQLAWSSGAVGMLALIVNGIVSKLSKWSDTIDSSATEEQIAVQRIQAAIASFLFLAALSVGLFVFFGYLQAAGFVWTSTLVFLTAFMAMVTAVYEAASVFRKGRVELNEVTAVPLTYEEFDA